MNYRMKPDEGNEKQIGGYRDGGESLYDEMLKLDALVYLQVLRFRDLCSSPGNNDYGWPGLCIKDEDVGRLLGKSPGSRDESAINEALDQVESIRKKILNKIEISSKEGIYLPFYYLAHLFQLTPFEMDILLVCLGPESDAKYEKLYAYLQDDVTKKTPSVHLILDLLCGTQEERTRARACFFDRAPLFKHHLIRFIDGNDNRYTPRLSRGLKLDDRIVNYLLGFKEPDFRLSSLAEIIIPQKEWSELVIEERIKEEFLGLAAKLSKEKPVKENRVIIYLKGTPGTGKKSTAEAFCRELQLPLLIFDARNLLNPEFNVEEVLHSLFREALLQPAAIYIDYFDRLISQTDNPRGFLYQKIIGQLAEQYCRVTFLAGEAEWKPPLELRRHFFMSVTLGRPPFLQRKRLWQAALEDTPGIDIDGIASKFRFTGGQIREAASEARKIAALRSKNENNENASQVTMEDLYRCFCAMSNRELSGLARKIKPVYTWADIVLPPDKLRQLKEMCNYVKYRHVVYHQWGFEGKLSTGKGLNILFSGPSGTGKTMAAEIIANELRLDLYKIDLSAIVSKYIGETEKKLALVFKEAETVNAVLFFDEADALFGKRSEVKDAHDRYANIEIDYLLQEMEMNKGIVILATNFCRNIDDAFIRRLHFSLDFPFPDEEYRFYIWQKVFPSETPRSRDIDFEFIARQFKLSGGGIKNIALNAAFLAADNSRLVNMEHILHAAKREYQKMGRICSEGEFSQYYPLVKDL